MEARVGSPPGEPEPPEGQQPSEWVTRAFGIQNRWTGWGLSVACGILFCVVFGLRYQEIPDHDYKARDDAVITLSHARGLVETATLSVSASGERVEGYSSPLQALIYFLVYLTSGVHYDAFCELQTVICTFLLGLLFHRILAEESGGAVEPFVLGLPCAVFLTCLYSFFEWHGSGMENALTHVGLLATIWLLVRAYRQGKASSVLAGVVCLAALARTEAVFYVFPLVALFALQFHRAHRRKDGFILALVFVALWLGVNGARWVYFGDWRPNTAYAQRIEPLERIRRILALDRASWKDGLDVLRELIRAHGIWFGAAAVPLWLFPSVRQRSFGALLALLLGVMCLVQPFVFGGSWLDYSRTTTQAALATCLLPSLLLLRLRTRELRYGAMGIFVVLAVWTAWGRTPYYVCCPASAFEAVRAEVIPIAREHALFRPALANPDLGAVSWHKEFNIVDLGKLGSPVLARVIRPDDFVNYMFLLAAPDIIESHEFWSRQYSFYFDHPLFGFEYEALREKRDPRGRSEGLWLRRDVRAGSSSRERELLDLLARDFDAVHLERELELCRHEAGVAACAYVTRAAYRYLPEIEAAGGLEKLKSAFRSSPSARYDLAILGSRSRGDWYEDVLAFLEEKRSDLSGEVARRLADRRSRTGS